MRWGVCTAGSMLLLAALAMFVVTVTGEGAPADDPSRDTSKDTSDEEKDAVFQSIKPLEAAIMPVNKTRGKVFRIGTVRYNWPMSAHASQAFSIAHCTDSEDLPTRVICSACFAFQNNLIINQRQWLRGKLVCAYCIQSHWYEIDNTVTSFAG